jgi:hypothetical protein
MFKLLTILGALSLLNYSFARDCSKAKNCYLCCIQPINISQLNDFCKSKNKIVTFSNMTNTFDFQEFKTLFDHLCHLKEDEARINGLKEFYNTNGKPCPETCPKTKK